MPNKHYACPLKCFQMSQGASSVELQIYILIYQRIKQIFHLPTGISLNDKQVGCCPCESQIKFLFENVLIHAISCRKTFQEHVFFYRRKENFAQGQNDALWEGSVLCIRVFRHVDPGLAGVHGVRVRGGWWPDPPSADLSHVWLRSADFNSGNVRRYTSQHVWWQLDVSVLRTHFWGSHQPRFDGGLCHVGTPAFDPSSGLLLGAVPGSYSRIRDFDGN